MLEECLIDLNKNKNLGLIKEHWESEETVSLRDVNHKELEKLSIIECLKNGKLHGYATDVIKDEFGSFKDSKLVNAANKFNIIITPHVGGMTTEAQEIAYNEIIKNFNK